MKTRAEEFAEKVSNDLLNDPSKAKWEGTDTSWWLAKLATEVNAIGSKLNADYSADVEKLAISVASYAFIIANLQKTKPVKKRSRKKSK